MDDVSTIRATIEGAQERLQAIHDADDDTLDLETKLARQQVSALTS